MKNQGTSNSSEKGINIYQDAYDYSVDAGQRLLLHTDIMRKRGNIYHERIANGQPPVLGFNYEVIMDAREFEAPAGFALARIINRRKTDRRTKKRKKQNFKHEKRENITLEQEFTDTKTKRPLIIFDPRAGHGAGIGGSKEASEVGMALSFGHEVYFVFFYMDPMPGQTLTDVKNAEIRFLEEVVKRHPSAPRPGVIGNCQGGWSTAILGADRPDLVGPLLMNGSPLSFWAGDGYKSSMRYLGGILGGVWMNSYLSDLGNGVFDGANLVMNMERLNLTANNWAKYYNVYSNVDTEEKRYLDYEKWSGGYYKMTAEEIHQVVNDLFVGNKLEQGTLEMDKGNHIDLKNLDDPVLVFASKGDNITPPQQALFWIPKIYKTVDEIKRCQQVIVYLVHDKIGHLGIFVSSAVAKKEHQEIIGNIEMIDFLAPGLYEMVITKDPSKPGLNDYQIRFEERHMKDIKAYSEEFDSNEVLRRAAAFSEFNDDLYQKWVSPWVKKFVNKQSAEFLRQVHPLRTQRKLLSDLNPLLKPVKELAARVKEDRQPVAEGNFFMEMEKVWNKTVESSFNSYQEMRDITREIIFKSIYKNPMWDLLLPPQKESVEQKRQRHIKGKGANRVDKENWLAEVEKGGFTEGVIRMMLAIIRQDKIIDEKEMQAAGLLVLSHKRLKGVSVVDLKRIGKEQSRILYADELKALNALDLLIKTPTERTEAYELAEKIASAASPLTKNEKDMLSLFRKILQLNKK